LEEHDVPAAPVYNVAEVLSDPQVKHLDLLEEVEHPKVGKLKFVRPSVNFTNLPRDKTRPPPLLGEQTAAILSELGYDQTAIGDLERQGIVKTAQG
jgi:crotonobetainyl-CoA:carnitine CoA-transferase CaiB-like acyl-CoA transferase